MGAFQMKVSKNCLPLFVCAILCTVAAQGGGPPILTVCEALQNRLAYAGKVVMIVGRYSYSFEGRWLNEDCPKKLTTDGYAWENVVSLTYRGSLSRTPVLPAGFDWPLARLQAKLVGVMKT